MKQVMVRAMLNTSLQWETVLQILVGGIAHINLYLVKVQDGMVVAVIISA